MVEQPGKQPQTIGDALAQRMEVRRGGPSARAEAVRELGAVDLAVYQAVALTPTAELDAPASPPLERRGPLAPVAGDRRRDRRVRRQARTPRGAGGRARDRDDLGGRQSRHKVCRWPPAPGSGRTRPVGRSPRIYAGIHLVPVRSRRVGVRIRLCRWPAPAGAGRADPAARGRGRLFACPHRRALSGRRGGRLHRGSRHRCHGRSGMRPPLLTAGHRAGVWPQRGDPAGANGPDGETPGWREEIRT